MDSDWTASALFSPSKARVQQAQEKEWAAVTSWLSRKYGSRMPTFERNEETLQPLLTLANFNESADEQRNQIERIEKAAQHSLTRRPGKLSDEVLSSLQAELANEGHLDTLAETAVALDCSSIDTKTMAREIIALNATQFETQQQVKRVDSQLAALQAEGHRVQRLLQDLRSEAFKAPPDLMESTADLTKSTKNLKAKINEYEERLNAARATASNDDFEVIHRRVQSIASTESQIKGVEEDLKAFQHLPSDPRAARRKLEAARDQLRELITTRDRLFEGLVED